MTADLVMRSPSIILGLEPARELLEMVRAFVGDMVCQVTVDRDLGETWAVAVHPPPVGGVSSPPLVVKLVGNDRESATRGALEILQKAGRIDRFEL
jgi:hypothetical protein